MPNKTLLNELALSLINEDSAERRKQWANYIHQHKINLADLTSLIHSEKKTAMRFSWLVGDLCEMAPERVLPSVTYFFSKRNEIAIPNFDLRLAKMLWLCGIPVTIKGEAVDQLFKWLEDPQITVMTKTYALNALEKSLVHLPGIKNEFIAVIEDQIGKNTAAFDQRAKNILAALPG